MDQRNRRKTSDMLMSENFQLHVLDNALRYARSRLGPDITAQRLLILINVYLNEGLSQSELLEKLDATSITALSRNLADLSTRTSRKAKGPGIVELRVDPDNLRRKRVYLTGKGRQLLTRLVQKMSSASLQIHSSNAA